MSAGSYRLARKTYRGVPGWQITGGPSSFSVSIFFEHESAARRTVGKLRAEPGYWTTAEDFLP